MNELLAGLKANRRGIEPNCFWRDFLFNQGQYADAGRMGEIQKRLVTVNAKLKG